ncbi:hypothetical protein BDV96DRAFT_651099 [Lophiotrema nucula]|uniref:Uncharacterized protein n=1 Tax=Lophiotrema nucula TaxID=690887 RepID=A0A6A5YTK0_9PLEO|nr:hypothetical protein BDV96DRAFT_651099 [Lophiotrema nucula]
MEDLLPAALSSSSSTAPSLVRAFCSMPDREAEELPFPELQKGSYQYEDEEPDEHGNNESEDYEDEGPGVRSLDPGMYIDTLEPKYIGRERGLQDSGRASSEGNNVPNYLKPIEGAFFFYHSLSVELGAANSVLHRRVRRRREHNLCNFCAGLDFHGTEHCQLEDQNLMSRYMPEYQNFDFSWTIFELNSDIGDDVRYLVSSSIDGSSVAEFDETVQQVCPLCDAV